MDKALARKLLGAENYTCVLVRGGQVYSSRERGILPLVRWVDAGTDLRGYAAADKVVGKAAALLYVCLGVGYVFADVLSESGQRILREYGIENECNTLSTGIVNRAGTGLCPMEETVQEISSPKEAVAALRGKLQSMGIYPEN